MGQFGKGRADNGEANSKWSASTNSHAFTYSSGA